MEARKAWAKTEEAPWRVLNSAARLEPADFTKSLLDTGWCMGHRCRESLGAVFQPRRSRATSRVPWRLAAVIIQRASDNPGLYPEKGGINDEPR